jgi:alkylation response protein AidB-like acyl-CoA dehydrogenase
VNFALSDEQEFLKEAARGTLGRFATVAAAREALDGGELPDLWPAACEAGWPGLLIAEQHGGAGLSALEAMLVFAELGRVLASVPLLGHLPATFLLDAAGDDSLARLATGEARAAYLPVKPPSDVEAIWTADPRLGHVRRPAPVLAADGTVSGELGWVPDAPGAPLLAGVAVGEDGRARVVRVDAAADGVTVEPLTGYDATRSIGHVVLDGAPAAELDVDGDAAAAAWYVAQSLLAAESLGAVEVALEASVQYAKERFTFGRAIGSYQAVKHDLVEVLRRLENARSLMYYAGWAARDKPAELPLAASALRVAAGAALDHASRAQISVHGGIGATWEHDAPLYFRRAQLSRRLLGGAADAADRVAGELLEAARAAA